MPRADYPPTSQHTGQFRYRYYAGEFDWGSDAAVYLRYQDRNNCYRVQLSTEYQELILWHGIGGYLQIVPCKLEAGRSYALEVVAQGEHLQVYLDGAKKIDYWHTCLPTLSGGIGLAVYRATVAFQDVSVTALPAGATAAPAHQAVFSTGCGAGCTGCSTAMSRSCCWRRIRIPTRGEYSANVLSYHFVKLRPGYRPLYFGFFGVRENDDKTTRVIGSIADFKFAGQGSDRFIIPFDGATSDKAMLSHHTDVLTYDRVRGTYRHEVTVEVTFAKDMTLHNMEFADPLTYNNKEPGRQNKYRWLPAGHRWGVFLADDGNIYRHPISQSLNITGQNSWLT